MKERVRSRLVTTYESLSPLEEALIQLCSVIYEPTDRTMVWKCYLKAGLEFPGEEMKTPGDLGARLDKLQNLRLLDKNCRCHEGIVEVAMRRAVAQGRIYKVGAGLPDVESLSAWSDLKQSSLRCSLCRERVDDPFFVTSSGPLCLDCVEVQLSTLASKTDLSTWSVEDLKQALTPEGEFRRRLAVLLGMRTAQAVFLLKPPSFMDELMTLLVRNLGYDRSHPLDLTIRQAAFDTCKFLGVKVLNKLIQLCEPEPRPYYVNILALISQIALSNPEVKSLLSKAVQDPRPEVRIRVAQILGENAAPWTMILVQSLASDPDKRVRKAASEVVAQWKARHRRPFLSLGDQRSTSRGSPILDHGPLVRAVQQEAPLEIQYYYAVQRQCPRILRDFRIALYTGNVELSRDLFRRLMYTCSPEFKDPDPFVRVCNNPFDPQWFRTLPREMQAHFLARIFYETLSRLRPDEEILAYALDEELYRSTPETDLSGVCLPVVCRLVMGGRLAEARRWMTRIAGADKAAGLEGWVLFVEGRNEEALASFEKDLSELRKRAGSRSVVFPSIAGLFYVLALIKQQGPVSMKRASQYISLAESLPQDVSFLKPVLDLLKAILHVQNLQADKASEVLSRYEKHTDCVVTVFFALAGLWHQGRLTQEVSDAVSRVFIKARETGVNWLALESAELLRRGEEDTPIRRNTVEKIEAETGMKSMVSSMQIEEPWRRNLRALVLATSPGQSTGGGSAEVRLVWFLDFKDGKVEVRPVEQKLTAKGTWSRGRMVGLNRLHSMENLSQLSKQDLLLRAALERDTSTYYGGGSYAFNMDKALPALVGHPRVFLEKSHTTSVEITKGEPEVLITREGSQLKITFPLTVGDAGVVVVQETPTRYKVVELSAEHRQIAAILGPDGLTIPESAKEEVLNVIASISSHVIVHSAIGGTAKDIVEVQADPTPHVHLLPSGVGFNLEMFVRPFGEGGPYLKPARGVENVIAEVEGTRVQTRRDLKLEGIKAGMVESHCLMLAEADADADRQWFLPRPDDCLQVLVDLKGMQEKGEVVVAWPEGEKLKVTRQASFDQLRVKIDGKTDWFEFSGELRVDDGLVLDMKKLMDLLKMSKTRFVPLGEGHFLALTKELRKRLDELDAYSEKKGKDLRLHPLAALALEDLTSQVSDLQADDSWKLRLERVRDAQDLVPVVPSTLKTELRDYQVEGYRWLARLAHMGVGACLADDMGLGKTIQTLAVFLERASKGPALVVAPTSVCMNWLSETARFAPTLNIVPFGGHDREDLVNSLGPMDVLVSSYTLLYQEVELLSSRKWSTIVLDEAQAIKNVLTKRSQAAMNLDGEFKMITTGTPIENHLGEFWTLFSFINPGLLGSQKRFNERYAIPIEKYGDREARKRLKKLIQPFILRRVKSQVLEELPPRTEIVLQVEMSREETAFYEALRQQAVERLERDHSPIGVKHLKILTEILRLRQAACNPRLVLPETSLSSAKLELFGEVISELLESRHKALVFSQFVGHLTLIREYLDARKINYRYLDGSTPQKDRKREVDAFQSGDGDLFLISLKAGGLGLNLTAADYVIHMDPWWNPAVEDQASDRAHRIGQLHPVTVYRLVTQNTIEEKIVRLHQEKRDLAGSLLDGSDMSGKISAEELMKLIKEE